MRIVSLTKRKRPDESSRHDTDLLWRDGLIDSIKLILVYLYIDIGTHEGINGENPRKSHYCLLKTVKSKFEDYHCILCEFISTKCTLFCELIALFRHIKLTSACDILFCSLSSDFMTR